jgi:hypothetical protein
MIVDSKLFLRMTLVAGLLFTACLNFKSDSPQPASKTDSSKQVVTSLSNIKVLLQWEVDGQELLCTIEKSSNQMEMLKITDSQKKVLFLEEKPSFFDLRTAYLFREVSPQLLFASDEGGSSHYWINILDYKDGRIIHSTNETHIFESGYYLRPQFSESGAADKLPFELHLFQGGGINSPSEKIDNIYRYKNGKYQFHGSYKLKDIDQLMNKLIANPK